MSCYWLLKTEPHEYSFADLVRDGETPWDGVRNALAQKNMRAMAVGDPCLIYHTGDERAAVGVAQVTSDPYPDPKADDDKRVVVDLKPRKKLKIPITLSDFKADPAFADSPLVRQGRLSVVPLSDAQARVIEAKAGRS